MLVGFVLVFVLDRFSSNESWVSMWLRHTMQSGFATQNACGMQNCFAKQKDLLISYCSRCENVFEDSSESSSNGLLAHWWKTPVFSTQSHRNSELGTRKF